MEFFPRTPFGSEPVARATDPETSHAAAMVAGRRVRESQVLVLETLAAGPMTDEEMQAALARPMSLSGSRTRRKELTRYGLVVNTGHTRPTVLGNRSIVWQVTERGSALLAGDTARFAGFIRKERSPGRWRGGLNIRVFFAWYDLWIGVYWSRPARVLYICPLPMVCIRIEGPWSLHTRAMRILAAIAAGEEVGDQEPLEDQAEQVCGETFPKKLD